MTANHNHAPDDDRLLWSVPGTGTWLARLVADGLCGAGYRWRASIRQWQRCKDTDRAAWLDVDAAEVLRVAARVAHETHRDFTRTRDGLWREYRRATEGYTLDWPLADAIHREIRRLDKWIAWLEKNQAIRGLTAAVNLAKADGRVLSTDPDPFTRAIAPRPRRAVRRGAGREGARG